MARKEDYIVICGGTVFFTDTSSNFIVLIVSDLSLYILLITLAFFKCVEAASSVIKLFGRENISFRRYLTVIESG